ncbi:site-specific integrase [Syntrophotalea acetylenica]|uniref:integrase n=1 Tax=Syntrophotalea acetylenica TaxID=29542 RepID=UPI002A359B89|nr:site-specific integrase [Syntrophotalea acetylenica]MDY0261898.1 site-specific integrase [Syntrophotalea acetylenica]
MASINKRGPYQWQVKIRRKGYPLQSKTFETEEDAKKWARLIESEMDRGIFVCQAEAEKTTLEEALKRYKREITPGKKGKKQEESRINILSRSPLGPRYLASIRGTDVAKYRDERLLERSPITVNNELILLSHLYTVAKKEWGMEGLRNPVRDIRKPKQPSGRDRRLRPGEEERLLKHTPPRLRPLIVLALETAMRLGELVNLRWENINLARRTAHLPETKNDSARTVPLSTSAIKEFKALPRHLDGQIFTYSANAASIAFSDLVKKQEIENLRFHDLRHEATSRLFEKGLNPMEVASITGHKTLQMLKRYTHLRAEDLAEKLG